MNLKVSRRGGSEAWASVMVIVVVALVVYAALWGWVFMLLMGSLHSAIPAVPPIGYVHSIIPAFLIRIMLTANPTINKD